MITLKAFSWALLFTAKLTEVAPRFTVFHLPLPLSRHVAQDFLRAAKVAVALLAIGPMIDTAPTAWQPRLEAGLLRDWTRTVTAGDSLPPSRAINSTYRALLLVGTTNDPDGAVFHAPHAPAEPFLTRNRMDDPEPPDAVTVADLREAA